MTRRILAIIRMLVGVLLVAVSIQKFGNAGFFEPVGLARELSENGMAFPFYQALLDRFILPNATVFAYLVAAGELIVGVSFLLGAFTNIFSVAATFMVLNFTLAVCYQNTSGLIGHLVFLVIVGVLGVYSTGATWGLDPFLARRLSTRLVYFPYGARR